MNLKRLPIPSASKVGTGWMTRHMVHLHPPRSRRLKICHQICQWNCQTHANAAPPSRSFAPAVARIAPCFAVNRAARSEAGCSARPTTSSSTQPEKENGRALLALPKINTPSLARIGSIQCALQITVTLPAFKPRAAIRQCAARCASVPLSGDHANKSIAPTDA